MKDGGIKMLPRSEIVTASFYFSITCSRLSRNEGYERLVLESSCKEEGIT